MTWERKLIKMADRAATHMPKHVQRYRYTYLILLPMWLVGLALFVALLLILFNVR